MWGRPIATENVSFLFQLVCQAPLSHTTCIDKQRKAERATPFPSDRHSAIVCHGAAEYRILRRNRQDLVLCSVYLTQNMPRRLGKLWCPHRTRSWNRHLSISSGFLKRQIDATVARYWRFAFSLTIARPRRLCGRQDVNTLNLD